MDIYLVFLYGGILLAIIVVVLMFVIRRKPAKRRPARKGPERSVESMDSDTASPGDKPAKPRRTGGHREIIYSMDGEGPMKIPQMQVFICHSSGDKPKAYLLYQRLRKDGINPWLDAEDLIPGQDWQVEIPKAVKESQVVLVCLSNNSITKEGYVQREIKFALDVADEKPEGTIYLIPVKLEPCEVPFRLSKWHWVDFYEEGGYEKLLKALRLREQAYMLDVLKSSGLELGSWEDTQIDIRE